MKVIQAEKGHICKEIKIYNLMKNTIEKEKCNSSLFAKMKQRRLLKEKIKKNNIQRKK